MASSSKKENVFREAGFVRNKRAFAIRSAYGSRSRVHPHIEGGESMTKQEFKDECNVNNIVAKHKATGLLTHLNAGTPQFGDFSEVHDFMSAQNALISATDAFNSLPAKARKEFDNDPHLFLEFVKKGDYKEMERLGLIKLKEVPPIEGTPPSPPQAQPPKPKGD